jgi:hypothetical protein
MPTASQSFSFNATSNHIQSHNNLAGGLTSANNIMTRIYNKNQVLPEVSSSLSNLNKGSFTNARDTVLEEKIIKVEGSEKNKTDLSNYQMMKI